MTRFSVLVAALTPAFFVPAPAGASPESKADGAAAPYRGPVMPGTQPAPPPPMPPKPPPLSPAPERRRDVRGCPIGYDCNDPLEAGLLAFERTAFPEPGASSPWVDGDNPNGVSRIRYFGAPIHGPVPRPLGSLQASSGKGPSPLSLRPDLPWLADLEMPDLPVHWHPYLIRYLEFYKSDPRGRAIMSSWLRAQGRYGDMIVRELRAANLPVDLVYVAMIESAYNPHNYSRVGASGIWQFMPGAGRVYGLDINRWVDERNDPVRATRAAVLYFKDLYQRFGDWDLALAAYNGGYGAVLYAMAKYNTNDFWQLIRYENSLPWGSTLYVPKALAAAIVGRNREVFGFDEITPDPPVTWATVKVPRSVSLKLVARAAGVPLDEIERLNPQLRRKRTPPGKPYQIRVPQGRARIFAERLPQLKDEWDKYEAYVVRHGDRFEDIATAHGISTRQLMRLNGLKTQAEVHGGTVIVVPQVSEAEKQANREKANAALYASGIPNNDDPGDKLIVAVPDPTFTVDGKRRVFYRVVAGNTLYGIASAFDVDRFALAEWNGLTAEAHLVPRMVLQVWIDPDFDLAGADIKVLDPARVRVVDAGTDGHLDAAESEMGRERFTYTAEETISYERIGRKFGLTARDLARINRKPPDTVLEPGDTCTIYRVVNPKESDRAKGQKRRARRSR